MENELLEKIMDAEPLESITANMRQGIIEGVVAATKSQATYCTLLTSREITVRLYDDKQETRANFDVESHKATIYWDASIDDSIEGIESITPIVRWITLDTDIVEWMDAPKDDTCTSMTFEIDPVKTNFKIEWGSARNEAGARFILFANDLSVEIDHLNAIASVRVTF